MGERSPVIVRVPGASLAWSGTGALRVGEPWTSPWARHRPRLRVLVESLPVVPVAWVRTHDLGDCLGSRWGWVTWQGLAWHCGRLAVGELPFGTTELPLATGAGMPAVSPGSWQALCLRRPAVPWAAWTVVNALSLADSHEPETLPAIQPDATGRTVGIFDGRLVGWGRSRMPVPEPARGLPWVVRPGRGGPRVCVPGPILQEELLIATGKVLTVQSGRSPSSIVMRVVGEAPIALPPGMASAPSTPEDDVWAGSPKLPSLSLDHPRFPAVSRRRNTVTSGISVSAVLDLEVAHAQGWLDADPALGLIALCGPVSVERQGTIRRRRQAGYLDDGYQLTRAGWWRLAFLAGQGVGEVERYRARRLFRAGKTTHLRKVQRLVLGYRQQGGIPLGVEISLTAQALGTWLGIGRPDALVWLDEPAPTLVWIEVESRALKWAGHAKQSKFNQLSAALREAAGALDIDIELCIQEVRTVTRDTLSGRHLVQQAWAAGLPGTPPVAQPASVAKFTPPGIRGSDSLRNLTQQAWAVGLDAPEAPPSKPTGSDQG